MDDKQLSCRSIAEIFCAAVIVGVFIRHYPTSPSDWAGWVQAFGSIAAIRVAVWVFERQREADAAREADKAIAEQRNFLLGVKAELAVSWEHYMSLVGRLVDERPTGIVDVRWQMPEKPCIVYEATAQALGALDDDNVRQSVIAAYCAIDSLRAGWALHNELIRVMDECLTENRLNGTLGTRSRLKQAEDRLMRYSVTLRGSQSHTRDTTSFAIKCIAAWEERHRCGQTATPS